MGGAGFEPAKALPPDLQSGPFGRLGIHPKTSASAAQPAEARNNLKYRNSAELAVGLELTTLGLQNRCSTG
jgi:hypothetical protein